MNIVDPDVEACAGDFWLKLEEAMVQAGGGVSIERLSKMPLSEIVDLLAVNGIRMTYSRSWHLDPK